jgi:hypothetical protein
MCDATGRSSLAALWPPRLRHIAAAGMLATLAATAHATDNSPIHAIWRSQQVALIHRADATLYRCSDLASRVTAILRAIGARSEVNAGPPCVDYTTSQVLNLVLTSPMPATDENVAAATAFTPTQRLVAEVRRESLPTANDIERFPATWQTVRLMRTRSFRLALADCELLHSVREQIFPKLSLRIPSNGLNCPRGSTSIQPRVVIEALIRVDS